MTDYSLEPIADASSLGRLPELRAQDRQVLERLLWLAPDVAVSTAAAVVRTHQPDLHESMFGRDARRETPLVGNLARALVYLGLAMAAPVQGKLLPILGAGRLKQTRANAMARFVVWQQAARVGASGALEKDAIPDPELRAVLDALIERSARRLDRDPGWLRAVVYGEAGALYQALAEACAEQFGGAVDLEAVADHLGRVGRTRDLLADVLAEENARPAFDPERQRALIERLRSYGWREHVASRGQTLREIAREAADAGLRATTTFALTDEWAAHGASEPTAGQRFFIRPTLLPDSEGLALWAQEERLKPLQKMLAGDPAETGLVLRLASVELLLEYATRAGQLDFLGGAWTRTSNRYDGMQTRFGGMRSGAYGITLFPGARIDEAVGVCPIVEVVTE